MPKAASGAWYSMLSLVDQGTPGMPRDKNISWYNSVGFFCIKALTLFTNVRSASNFFYNGVVPYSYLYNAICLGVLNPDNIASPLRDCSLNTDARASLIKSVVIVLPLILGTIIGPSPPPPALTTTGFLAAVPKLPVFFWPAASWLTAFVKFASVLSSFVS